MEVTHTLIMLSARCSSLSAIQPVTSGSATRWLCWRNNISNFLRSPNGGKKLIWLSFRSSLRRTRISYITWTFRKKEQRGMQVCDQRSQQATTFFMNTGSGVKRLSVFMWHFYMCKYISINIYNYWFQAFIEVNYWCSLCSWVIMCGCGQWYWCLRGILCLYLQGKSVQVGELLCIYSILFELEWGKGGESGD